MHKVFVSYYHKDDQEYKDRLVEWAEEHQVFIDVSVDTGEISDELSDESIRKKIRDEYLKDSTVTIVLVGAETRRRKHVDWEIYSSMYDGTVNKKSGIIAIILPNGTKPPVYAPHGKEEKDLYPEAEWKSVDGRAEYERSYPTIPERLIDNLVNSKAKISVVPWSLDDTKKMSELVEIAFDDRVQCEYDLSRPMRRSNS